MLEYKKSKYTYLLKNPDNEIIFYNFLYKQLCKFTKEYTHDVESILTRNNIYDDEKNPIMQELIKRKLIVPIYHNEQAISDMEFIEEISNYNYLGYVLYPTMRCNFRCPYCYQDHQSIDMDDKTVEAIIKHARRNISKFRGIVILWFGGEPLLRMDIFEKLSSEMIKICNTRNRTYEATITTNGYYLTRDNFEKMIKLNTKKITVTIDGLKRIHNNQRLLKDGSGSFDTIIRQLLEIKKISKNISFEINIRSNVSLEGYDDLDNYVKYMSSLFGDDDRFCFSFRPVYDWGGDSIDDFKEHLLPEDNKKNVYKRLLDINVPLNYRQHVEEIVNSSICYACRKNFYAIEADGRISKCTSASKDLKDFYIGKLLENGEMILDKNIIAKWASKYTNRKACENCFFEANCHSNFCLIEKIVYDIPRHKCPRSKTDINGYLLLLDQSNKKYPYIEIINPYSKETNA